MKVIINIIISVVFFVYTIMFFINKDSGNILMGLQNIVFGIIQISVNLILYKSKIIVNDKMKLLTILFLLQIIEFLVIYYCARSIRIFLYP